MGLTLGQTQPAKLGVSKTDPEARGVSSLTRSSPIARVTEQVDCKTGGWMLATAPDDLLNQCAYNPCLELLPRMCHRPNTSSRRSRLSGQAMALSLQPRASSEAPRRTGHEDVLRREVVSVSGARPHGPDQSTTPTSLCALLGLAYMATPMFPLSACFASVCRIARTAAAHARTRTWCLWRIAQVTSNHESVHGRPMPIKHLKGR